jgi:pimeloyl-ACP methyl ester carboxylesterase
VHNREFDVTTSDGRTIHAYETGPDQPLTVVWHHGTPNIGSPPAPLFDASERLGIRWVSYDRPGYGGSTPRPDRSVGSAAADVAAVVDALRIARFAVMGHSGGSPHGLACAALLPDRVTGVVAAASLAPFDAQGLDWFAGMIPSGVAALTAAARGRAEKERFETSGFEYDPEFTAADEEALAGPWKWFGSVVGPALKNGPAPAIDDDLAYVAPWGFDPSTIRAQVLLLHGDEDRIAPLAHAQWLADRIPGAELRVQKGAGHISVLNGAEGALEWLASIGGTVGR